MIYVPSKQMNADMVRRERLVLKVYPDSKGLATQGIGRHHGVNFGDPDITEETAYVWLAQDLQRAYVEALELFHDIDTFDVVRREALIDVAFNMGGAKLAQFAPFIAFVNNRDWPSAHLHLLTNMQDHLTPYLLQVGKRAVDVAGRIATGLVPAEYRVL